MPRTREEENLQRAAPYGALMLGVMCAAIAYDAGCQGRGIRLQALLPQWWVWNAALAVLALYGLSKVNDTLSRATLITMALAQAAPAYADITDTPVLAVGGIPILLAPMLLTAAGLRSERPWRMAALAVVVFVLAFAGAWTARRMGNDLSGRSTVLQAQPGC